MPMSILLSLGYAMFLMLICKMLSLTGAKQPLYLVTADDVDTYLAIEVQPLDDRKRKVLSVSTISMVALIFWISSAK